jgi:hypothetical protein
VTARLVGSACPLLSLLAIVVVAVLLTRDHRRNR